MSNSAADSPCLIDEQIIEVDRSALDGVEIIAAIDRGCSLTKAIYSTESKDPQRVKLHFALFKNSQFTSALRHLKSAGVTSVNGSPLHVTGVGCDKYREEIKEELGISLKFVNESQTHGVGFHWLMRHAPPEFLFHPKPECSEVVKLASRYLKTINTVSVDASDGGSQDFPCVLLCMGSGAGVFSISESGAVKQEASIWLAGITFLSLGKALVGVDNYDELMQLAANGDRSRVDMQVKDVLANDAESPYGQFPPEAPVFSFAKMLGDGVTLSSFSSADIARSLVHAFANNTIRSLALAAKALRAKRALLGGNFFRHELMRQEAADMAAMVVGDQIRIDFIRTGHTGAMGALLTC